MGGFYEMELNYIDIGCNLMGKQFKDDREQVVEQSLADGVGLIITCLLYTSGTVGTA